MIVITVYSLRFERSERGIRQVLGSQTRDALVAFQLGQGLVMTAAIHQPTLELLGLA